MKVRYCVLACTLFWAFIYAYDWPIQAGNVQHTINGTLGEWRSTHLHGGVDINAPCSTTVHTIEGDTCYKDTIPPVDGINIGHSRYYHVAGYVYPDTTFIPAGTYFAKTNGEDHVHLQEADRRLTAPGPSANNAEWLNPLRDGAVTPYNDNAQPHTDSIKFYRQGSSTQLDSILDGKVDVLSVAGDPRTDSTGQSAGDNCSIYRIGYEVHDTHGAVVKPLWEEIIFDAIPSPPNEAQRDLTYGSGSTPSHFRYWVSNDPFNADPLLRNRYWNTKQRAGQPDSVDADSIENAEFPDGDYWVKVKAYDIRSNADSESVQVVVANFRPEVRETEPDDGETGVSIHQTVYVRFSEAMDSSVDLRSAISITPGVNGDWQWLNDKSILFTPDPAFEKNKTYTVSLGMNMIDLQGQALIPYSFSFTTDTTTKDMEFYPTKSQWEANITWWDVSVSWFDNYYAPQVLGYFEFPFYGYSYSLLIFNRRGCIWFNTNHDLAHFDLPTSGGTGDTVIAVYNDSLRHLLGGYSRGRSRELFNPNREVIRWTFYAGDTTEFEAVLFESGAIRLDYRKCDIDSFYNDGGSGISAGNGTNYSSITEEYGPVYLLAPGSFSWPSSYTATKNPPPGFPRQLDIIEQQRSGNVNLVWRSNPEPDLAGYCVYRSDNSFNYGAIPYDTVMAPETTYSDISPLSGSNYYVVTAFDTFDYESRYSNEVEVFVDVHPPSAPYVNPVEKSGDDIVLMWNKITTDTLGNSEAIDFYVVYRDTFPSFIPDSLDSIGYVIHPETTYTDSGALNTASSYYYLVKAVDAAGNKSKRANMGFKLNKFFNENPTATDRNWVSLPWHCSYDSVPDLTDDLSASGDPLTKIANLRDDQLYESWLWDPDFGEWYGAHFAITPGRGYETITTKDTSVFLVGSNNPNGLVTLNENPTTTDRNWVSIPYNSAYSTVSDITDEYSPSGNPLTKITNLRNDQLYESWLWDPDFGEWYGTDFVIECGRGYEFITIIDTTWNPTEYSNEAKGFCIAENRKYRIQGEVHCGTSSKPDREPVWILEQSNDELLGNQLDAVGIYLDAHKYRLNKTISAKTIYPASVTSSGAEKQYSENKIGSILDEKISHVVRAYIVYAHTYSDIVFTAYRLNNPKDVLTENMIGSNTVTQQDLGTLWFDVGNFKTPWKGGEEVVLIIEAIKKGKPYIDIENFKLDETVDIQELGKIELEPSFNFGSQGNEPSVLKHKSTSDNIIGYSLYKNSKRLNEKVLQDERSIPPDVSVKLVIVGGHETVYSSDNIQKEPEKAMPMSFAFAFVPNPFAKQTRIDYALPMQASVEIVIYDVSGRKVKALASEMQNAGYYFTIWNGSDDQGRRVAAGVYFVRFEAGDHRVQDKILLIR